MKFDWDADKAAINLQNHQQQKGDKRRTTDI
jgi:uncharacterized DUF497 family protein